METNEVFIHMTWQPIETKPDDLGTYIVTDGKRVTIWSNGFMPHNESSLVFVYGKPTHWMPMPKPPELP